MSFFLAFPEISEASAPACGRLFGNEPLNPKILEASVTESRDFFINSEAVTSKLVNEGVLTQLRTASSSKDHIDFFSQQVPVIAHKLAIRFTEAWPIFSRTEHQPRGKRNAEKFQRSKDLLKRNLEESYRLLLEEATQRVESQTVTYEWYMNFFLKTLIFSDVSLRIQESTNMKQFEFFKKQLDIVLGNSKVFSAESLSELRLYSALGKEFSTLTKDAYFTKSLLEDTLVPVLFIPRDADIIRAERAGIHFVSLNISPRHTLDGSAHPLQFAARQVEQRTKQLSSFRDLVNNSKSKWIKFHDRIVRAINGNKKLEALYAYILRDAGLQFELTKRFDIGFRILFSFDAHKSSEYLREYFKQHQADIAKVADKETQETFLKIIYAIEKEALASRS